MIFKGKRWVICRTVVALPQEMWHGEQKNYVMFGKLVPHNTPGAIKTTRVWRGHLPRKMWGGDERPPPDGKTYEGKIVGGMSFNVYFWHCYVIPIKNEGHSLTNLMYAPNGYTYLLHDDQVYVRGPGARK